MGCYSSKSILSSCFVPTDAGVQYNVALKLPHGQDYLEFLDNRFIIKPNVSGWVHDQFAGKQFTSYINYND